MVRFIRLARALPFLRRHAPILITSLLGAGAIGVGCTQNFGVFEPSGSSTTTTGTGGTGGAATTSTTTTGTGGAGGATTTTTTATTTTTTTSTTTGSGGGTGGGTTSTTTTGTGGGSVENCVNGLDDDNNGMIDCADPACMPDFTCAPVAPPSWNGPITLFDGSPAMLPADCPPEHPLKAYEGNQGLIQEPASCSACSCSNPAVTCAIGILLFRKGPMCATGLDMAMQPGDGMCGPINPPAMTDSYTGQTPLATAGNCSPSGGSPTIPPPKWQTSALACAGGGLGTGCGAQSACIAKSGAPFDSGFCVWKSGDKSCPAGFTSKHLYSDNVIDNRDCSACTCGNATATCSVTTTVYASADCSGAGVDVPNNTSCVDGAPGASIKPSVTKSGSCVPGGGNPTGNVQEGGSQTTICCTP